MLRQNRSVSYIHSDDKASMNVADYVQLPRATASSIWNEAVKEAISGLDEDADIRLISTHLTLYERSKSVFFSPSRLATLSSERFLPSSIVLLIDDIFDMHKRLAEHNKIFSEKQIAKDVRQDTLEAAWPDTNITRPFTEVEEELFRVEARVGILNLLISWRRQEMLIAENVASQLNIPLYLIGVKHPIKLFELITREELPPSACYVSHPITSVRRGVVDPSSAWPSYAARLNTLPSVLLAHDAVGIMPTAIDELRFGLLDIDNQVNVFTTGLRPRWPLIDEERIVDELPAREDESGFDTETVEVHQAYVSGLLRGLWLTLANEVPFRDHYLVANTKNFLAYRPREGGEGFSRGVQAEMNHFSWLANLDSSRRMAVIHDVQDVRAIQEAARGSGDLIPIGVDAVVTDIQNNAKLVGVQDLSDNDTLSLLRHRRMPTGLLSRRGGSEEALLQIRDNALIDHARFSLYRYLTGFRTIHSWCHVIVANLSSDDWAESAVAWLSGEGTYSETKNLLACIDNQIADNDILAWIEDVRGWGRQD